MTIQKYGDESAQKVKQGVDLGRWMGRRDAFALISGAANAADIESLRRIRDDKQYRAVARNWDEFCTNHLRISRRTVDKNISYLEEFGPQFFLLKQMAQVSPNEYRAIATHVGPDGLRTSNGTVPLLPEKTEQVAAAVAELLKHNRKAAAGMVEPRQAKFHSILQRCKSAAEMLESYGTLQHAEKLELTPVLARLWELSGHQCLTIG